VLAPPPPGSFENLRSHTGGDSTADVVWEETSFSFPSQTSEGWKHDRANSPICAENINQPIHSYQAKCAGVLEPPRTGTGSFWKKKIFLPPRIHTQQSICFSSDPGAFFFGTQPSAHRDIGAQTTSKKVTVLVPDNYDRDVGDWLVFVLPQRP